jgi:hypothetical protein
MGLSCTPATNSTLEFYFPEDEPAFPGFMYKYDVPLKDGRSFRLHTICWPGLFHDKFQLKGNKKTTPRKWFLEILKGLSVPAGTEQKYENTKQYFLFVEKELERRPAALNVDE